MADAAAPSPAAAPPSPASGPSPDRRDDADASGDGASWGVRLAVGLGVLVLLGVVLWPVLRSLGASDDDGGAGGRRGASPGEPRPVDAVVVRPTSVAERLRTTGTLRAQEEVALTAETAGKVTRILFREGTRVERGQLLLTINDAELRAQRDRLGHRLTLAEQQLRRQRALLERGGASQETVDQVENEVEVLKADIDLVEAQIEMRKVRAPFTGTIGLRQVSEGAYLGTQTPIATLRRVDPIKLDFAVPEQYAGRVREGQAVTFTVRGSDAPVEGIVYAVEPAIDPATRTRRLRAEAPNAAAALAPGAFADVTLTLGTVDNALVVPAFAVIPALGSQRVFVADGGQATPRTVTLGVRTDSTVQVTDGLAPGDTVLTSNIQDLRAGLPIRAEVQRP